MRTEHYQNGNIAAVMFSGTLSEEKAERIEDIKSLAKQIGDEAFLSVDVERAALNAGTTGVNRQNIRSTYQAIFDRAKSLIQQVSDCTTPEEVWAINIDFSNLAIDPVPETNVQHVSGAPNIALSNAEVKISQVKITPSHINARIRIEARVDFTKDAGSTARVATVAIRNADANNAAMIGERCVVTSPAVANAAYGPALIIEIDSPNTTSEITYTLRGLVGAGASTAVRGTLTATEI